MRPRCKRVIAVRAAGCGQPRDHAERGQTSATIDGLTAHCLWMGKATDYVGNVSTEVQRNQSLKAGGLWQPLQAVASSLDVALAARRTIATKTTLVKKLHLTGTHVRI